MIQQWSIRCFGSDSKFTSRSIQDIGFTPTMWCAYLCLWCEFPSTLCFCRRFGLCSWSWLTFSRHLLFSLLVLFPMFDKEKVWIGGDGYQMLDEDGCAWRLGSLANFVDHGTVEETLNSQYLYMYICCEIYIYDQQEKGLKCDSKKWSGSGGTSTIQKWFSFTWFTSPKILFLNRILNRLLNRHEVCTLNPTIDLLSHPQLVFQA